MEALFTLCDICGGTNLHAGLDGFYYCSTCGSQSQQFQEQALDNDELAGYMKRARRGDVPAATVGQEATAAAEADPLMEQVAPIFLQAQLGLDDSTPWELKLQQNIPAMCGAYRPQEPIDPMETLDKIAASVRETYLQGLQEIIKMQCEALVKRFEVSPLVCGIVGPIWLRFIVFTCVCDKDWPKEVIQIEEARFQGRKKKKRRKTEKEKEDGEKEETQVVGTQGESLRVRRSLRWLFLEALKERIPLSVALAIIFLACHIAQETILPTDLVQWALDGNLPYLNAFLQLEKKAGFVWPIKARTMLRPADVLGARKLEFMAATIAKRIGLELPSINFNGISTRFLKQLNLPVDELFVYISRIKDWYTPPGLWLSEEVYAIASRTYVMGMIVIVLKVLYQFDGRWRWETTLAEPDRERDHSIDPWNAKQLLEKLEATLQNHGRESFDIEKHLDPYLKYCHDFVFTGINLGNEEECMCDQLWRLYEKPPKKDWSVSKELDKVKISEIHNLAVNDRIPLCMDMDSQVSSFDNADPKNSWCEMIKNNEDQTSPFKTFQSLNELIYDIEALGFLYLPPRTQSLKPGRYLRYYAKKSKSYGKKSKSYAKKSKSYAKKSKEGIGPRLLHADYFILLCACAKVISVHPVALYRCVQKLEMCLVQIEKKVEVERKV